MLDKKIKRIGRFTEKLVRLSVCHVHAPKLPDEASCECSRCVMTYCKIGWDFSVDCLDLSSLSGVCFLFRIIHCKRVHFSVSLTEEVEEVTNAELLKEHLENLIRVQFVCRQSKEEK